MARKKWEYLIFVVHNDEVTTAWNTPTAYFDVETNTKYEYASIEDAGLDGWELVSVDNSLDGTHTNWVFKREVEAQGPFESTAMDIPGISITDEIEDLYLTVSSYNMLKRNGINSISELLALTYKAFCRLQAGRAGKLDEIEARLRSRGYSKLCPANHWINQEG